MYESHDNESFYFVYLFYYLLIALTVCFAKCYPGVLLRNLKKGRQI